MKKSSKPNSKAHKIACLSLFEAFEEGNMQEFNQIRSKFSLKDSELFLMKDIDQRTGLHLICKKGHIDFFNYVLPFYRSLPEGLDWRDEKDDTPLSLACSHGFARDPDFENSTAEPSLLEEQIETFLAIKGSMVKDLLSEELEGKKAQIRTSFVPKKHSPLHWCIFYGDHIGGMAIYEEYPLSILFKNEDGETPLEIIFQKNLKKEFKARSRLLAKQIIESFVNALFSQDTAFIFKNSTAREQKQFADILVFKTDVLSPDLAQLMQRIFDKEKEPEILKVLSKNDALLKKLKSGEQNLLTKQQTNEPIQIDEEADKIPNNDLQRPLNFFSGLDQIIKNADQTNQEDCQSTFSGSNGLSLTGSKNSSLIDDSVDFNNNDNQDFAFSDAEITIFDEGDKRVQFLKPIRFLHKLLAICAQLNNVRVVRILIGNFRVSPFAVSIAKHSTIYHIAAKGKIRLLCFLLCLNYKYYQSRRTFSLEHCLNRPESFRLETPLHAACRFSRRKCFDALLQHGAKLTQYNYFNWQPSELSRKNKLIEIAETKIKVLEEEGLKKEGILQPDSFNAEALFDTSTSFQYLIIARDIEPDFARSLVYKQLMVIKSRLREGEFEVKVINPLKFEVDGFCRFYFLLKLRNSALDEIADQMNLRIYNFEKHFVESFMRANSRQFERFRDFHIHQIILHLLNSEFNIELYKKRGIIEDHFPLHNFPALKNIRLRWNQTSLKSYFQSFSLSTKPRDLGAYHSVAFYFGCPLAFYLAFNALYISWLIVISLVGVAFTVRAFALKEPMDNFLTPIYALIISLWVTVVFERWKQREKELAFIWNTLDFRLNEVPRIDYIGHFRIDKTSKGVTERHRPNRLSQILVG